MRYVDYCGSVWSVEKELGTYLLLSHTSDGRETTVRLSEVDFLTDDQISG